MASLNPSTDISTFVNNIYEGALLTARDQNVMAGLVRAFNDRTGIASRKNQQYGGASMNSIAETDDLVGQAFTPLNIATITPAEAGAQYFLTDTRIETDPFNVQRDAAQDLGEAMATKIETDLLSSFTSFTGGTLGAAGSAITWSYVFAAESILRKQKAPYPYNLILHPYQWNVLAKAASVAGSNTNAAPSLLEEVNRAFWVRSVGGVNIFVSANITPDASDDAVIGMFSRDAVAFDLRRAPRLEAERDASRRGYELNMSAVYGYGVWRPLFGVKMTFDASTPTS